MTFQERYQYNPKTDLLGKGGFARVYKARDTMLDREVAIKVFNATEGGQYTVIEEIKKAIKLQHPNLLRYYDVEVVENTNALGETDTLQIGVMELANAGDLKQFARRNPGSPLLFSLLQQVLSGLEYLHQKGIIHRDLKPQNILLVEEDGELTAKISDFGISKNLDSGTNSSSVAIGTIEYMAPEQFSPAKYGINGKISTNVDLWSFGIMVHELITNEPLFGQRNGNTTSEQIMNAILSQTLPPDIETLPEPYKTVVKKCLVSDARQRIQKARELIGLLQSTEEGIIGEDDASQETMQIDKSLLQKANQAAETSFLPKKDAAVEMKIEPEPVAKQATNKPNPAKTPAFVYILIALVIIGGAGGGFWWWQNKGSVQNSTPGVAEYHTAMASPANSAEWVSLMEKSAALNYDSAIFQLANYYMSSGNVSSAAPYIEILADTSKVKSNFPHIKTWYAKMLLEVKNKPKEAIAVLQSCATSGDADCTYELGMIFYEGKKARQDYAQAFKLFKQLADNGNDKAQTMLGNMYIVGQGVAQDKATALEYYFKAVEKGNSVAMYALGLLYLQGSMGVEKNEAEAKKMFQKVITKGDADCVYELGMMYYSGNMLQQDYVQAAKLFMQSAEKGNDKAQSQLGYMFILGQGVEKNYSKAIEYYNNAVQKGNSTAMYALGLLYIRGGMGVEKNEEAAKKLFKKVIAKGDNADAVKAAKQQLGEM